MAHVVHPVSVNTMIKDFKLKALSYNICANTFHLILNITEMASQSSKILRLKPNLSNDELTLIQEFTIWAPPKVEHAMTNTQFLEVLSDEEKSTLASFVLNCRVRMTELVIQVQAFKLMNK